jgi:IS30 family transposase
VQYRALVADRAAWELACRPKPSRLTGCARLGAVVEEKLEVRWSPEQIAGWLARQFPDQAEMQVSHESIYRSLFVQSRGALRKELTRHLRTKRAMRRPAGRRLPDGRGGRLHELTGADQEPDTTANVGRPL